jgi:hypothetical protein
MVIIIFDYMVIKTKASNSSSTKTKAILYRYKAYINLCKKIIVPFLFVVSINFN